MPLPLHLQHKYLLEETLHQDPVWQTHRVRQRTLGESRILRVARPGTRHTEELSNLVDLQHPNIARVYEVTFDDDGGVQLELEFIEGLELIDLAAGPGGLPVQLVIEIGLQALRALCGLHETGFIHQALSPFSFRLNVDSKGEVAVKLLDPGLSGLAGLPEPLTLGATIHSDLAYASPEHFGGCNGHTEIEARSDLYSLSIVLCQLLTGKTPIRGEDLGTILAGHLILPPHDLFTASNVPADLAEILRATLAKRIEDRPPDAESLTATLEEIQTNMDSLTLEDLPEPIRKLQVEQSISEIQDLLEERQLQAVESRLRELQGDLKGKPRVKELGHELARLKAQEKSLQQALEAFETNEFDAGHYAIKEAENLGTPSQLVDSYLRKEVEARRLFASEMLNSLKDRLHQKDLPTARRILDSARNADPHHPKLDSWQRELLRQEDQAKKSARVAQLAANVKELINQQDWLAAEETLASIEATDPENPHLGLWQTQIRDAVKKREEAQRQSVINETEDLLEQGQLDAAQKTLEQARRLGVATPDLERLERNLAERKANRVRASSHIQALPLLVDKEQWPQADRELEAAADFDPTHPELRGWIALVEEGKELQRRAARRERKLAEEIAYVEKLHQSNRSLSAYWNLQKIKNEYGETQEISKISMLLRLAFIRQSKRLATVAGSSIALGLIFLTAAQIGLGFIGQDIPPLVNPTDSTQWQNRGSQPAPMPRQSRQAELDQQNPGGIVNTNPSKTPEQTPSPSDSNPVFSNPSRQDAGRNPQPPATEERQSEPITQPPPAKVHQTEDKNREVNPQVQHPSPSPPATPQQETTAPDQEIAEDSEDKKPNERVEESTHPPSTVTEPAPSPLLELQAAIEAGDIEKQRNALARISTATSPEAAYKEIGKLLLSAAQEGNASRVEMLAPYATLQEKDIRQVENIVLQAIDNKQISLISSFTGLNVQWSKELKEEIKARLKNSRRKPKKDLVDAIAAALKLDESQLKEILEPEPLIIH